MNSRDNFPLSVVNALRQRVHSFCSNPACRRQTVGPHTDSSKVVVTGIAAHITAASPNGPRYDPTLTSEARKSAANGIWLCSICAKKIDSDEARYPVNLLLEWKLQAERFADEEMGSPRPVVTAPAQSDYVCPHCTTGFSKKQFICLGCRGQILWGATIEERKAAALFGALMSGFAVISIYDKLNIRLINLTSGLTGMIPLWLAMTAVGGCGILGIYVAERLRKGKPPRVIVARFA
ncbi:hypothetical protein KTE47_27820 [Burkholderia multivorans]|uniref:hypothetical protein n=1 Tax=Burkholderia multivorans TaxID=87883 RepID=UPI001C24FB2F|nr:hypothetical protein [Burkholderia multivorans]MBU9621420.1 hypothetical protein [Burkholderia multivorans]